MWEPMIQIFQETMALCRENERLADAVKASIANQYIIWQEDPLPEAPKRFDVPAALRVSKNRTLAAARPYAEAGKRVCILNFASSVTPGGGVTRGSLAQEEDLCRISTLYPAISHPETAGAFYARHWEMIRSRTMGYENRDDCIFTPGVIVVRSDDGRRDPLPEAQWYTVDAITCAAPDMRGFRPTPQMLLALHESRFRKILATAAKNGADAVILGAFGCGVFGNPPQIVRQAFQNVFPEYAHCFETIEFAVYSRHPNSPNYLAFAAIEGIVEI